MQVVSAKIIDPTHLELSHPLQVAPGQVIQISIAGPADEDDLVAWRTASKQRLADAYCDEDAVYDSQ